jgi:hypothetical protein
MFLRCSWVAAMAVFVFATNVVQAARPAQSADLFPLASKGTSGCLASGNGYLRARIRGALNLDINWKNAEIECEGGARPDGSGIRVSFAGPKSSDGRRVRMVFGLGSATEGSSGRALPTNLTVIFEGEKRLFATRGEDKCTVDHLQQQRVGDPGSPDRAYRVVARGFCTAPASALDGEERIVVTRFDFAGRVTFEVASDKPAEETKPATPNAV